MRTPNQILLDSLGDETKHIIDIHAFCVPYGVANTYNETIMPGTFADQAAVWWPIPILVEHQGLPYGWWLKAKDSPEGLYVAGILSVKDSKNKTLQEHFKDTHVSIDYLTPGNSRKSRLNIDESLKARRKVFEPNTVTIASLGEISLTETPAYEGTWMKFGRPDWAK